VVIVNYCQWRNSAALVRQLLAEPEARRGAVEVVVVDNHSPPHRLMSWMRRRRGVSLRRWGRNRGFARAANEGFRTSQAPWVLLLNPDVSVPSGFVQGVLDRCERLTEVSPRTGIVGVQMRNTDGTRQLSAGRFPGLVGTLIGTVLPRARRKYRPLHARKRCRVAWVSGCCLLVRRECARELGGFDPAYFLYYEDVDLCRRAQSLGWSVCFEPDLNAVHHRPLHTREVSPALRFLTRHGLLTYGERHWPTWQFRLLARIVQLEACWRSGWARWSRDYSAAEQFAELGRLAADFLHGRQRAAQRRVRAVVRRWIDRTSERDRTHSGSRR
jgi:GT2 family glycosyltransferase